MSNAILTIAYGLCMRRVIVDEYNIVKGTICDVEELFRKLCGLKWHSVGLTFSEGSLDQDVA